MENDDRARFVRDNPEIAAEQGQEGSKSVRRFVGIILMSSFLYWWVEYMTNEKFQQTIDTFVHKVAAVIKK